MSLRAENEIVAVARRERDEHDLVKLKIPGEMVEFGLKGRETGFRPGDSVHLVDDDDDAADTKHCDDQRVTSGLPGQSIGRADQQEGEVGRRCAGRHVPGVLLVPGRIRDDELAARGGEEAVRNVDRDLLLALRRKAIEKERKVALVTLRAML